MLIVQGTPVPVHTPSIGLSGGAIAGIVIAALFTVALLIWLSKLVTLYLYEVSDPALRPPVLENSTDNTCCDMACNTCNMAILKSCCPDQIKDVDLYAKDKQQFINVAGTTSNANGMSLML